MQCMKELVLQGIRVHCQNSLGPDNEPALKQSNKASTVSMNSAVKAASEDMVPKAT